MRKRRFSFALFLLVPAAAAFAAPPIHCTPPQPWAGDIGAPPRTPMVGDVDGDGYADLLAFYPEGKCIIDCSLNAYDQKSVWGFQARTDFGEKGLCATVGKFTGGKGAEVMAVFADGSVRLAHNFSAKDSKYMADDLLGKLSGLSKGNVLTASGQILGDGRDESVIEDSSGKVWVVSATAGEHTKGTIVLLGKVASGASAIAVADFAGGGKPELVVEDSHGSVWVEPIEKNRLGKVSKLFQGKPRDNLVAGEHRGDRQDGPSGGNHRALGRRPEEHKRVEGTCGSGHRRAAGGGPRQAGQGRPDPVPP